MDLWWVTVICIEVIVPMHCIAEFRRSSVAAGINVFLHLCAIIMLLLLGAELLQVFVLLMSSVTADLVFRQAALTLARKAKERAEKPDNAQVGSEVKENAKIGEGER